MLTSGDVVDLDLGAPTGREAGFVHPAIVVTAQALLDANPWVVHIVPPTSTIRAFDSEVRVEPDPTNGLGRACTAQCQHVRSVAVGQVLTRRGNVGPEVLAQVCEVLGLIFDIRW